MKYFHYHVLRDRYNCCLWPEFIHNLNSTQKKLQFYEHGFSIGSTVSKGESFSLTNFALTFHLLTQSETLLLKNEQIPPDATVLPLSLQQLSPALHF